MKNIVFLPCRKGSQRIPNKNTRDFAGIHGGLLRIKLEQLLKVGEVDKIILSSNDDEVFEVARQLKNSKVEMLTRDESLCSSATSTDELIRYVGQIIREGTVLWTHVTSPFLGADTYSRMLKTYHENLGQYDSLMAVNELRTFIWDGQGPVNYDKNVEKWPRTQTLNTWYEVNSAAFIADTSVYKTLNDRVGNKVFMFPTSQLESIDIDWPDDFAFAEKLYKLYNK